MGTSWGGSGRLFDDIDPSAELRAWQQSRLGAALRDRGMALTDAAAEEAWRAAADAEIRRRAATGEPFTSEDVSTSIPGTEHPHAMGARFLAARRAGLIVPTGRTGEAERASHHRGLVREWIGTGA